MRGSYSYFTDRGRTERGTNETQAGASGGAKGETGEESGEFNGRFEKSEKRKHKLQKPPTENGGAIIETDNARCYAFTNMGDSMHGE